MLEKKLSYGGDPSGSKVGHRNAGTLDEMGVASGFKLTVVEVDEDHLSRFRHGENGVSKELNDRDPRFCSEVKKIEPPHRSGSVADGSGSGA